MTSALLISSFSTCSEVLAELIRPTSVALEVVGLQTRSLPPAGVTGSPAKSPANVASIAATSAASESATAKSRVEA